MSRKTGISSRTKENAFKSEDGLTTNKNLIEYTLETRNQSKTKRLTCCFIYDSFKQTLGYY